MKHSRDGKIKRIKSFLYHIICFLTMTTKAKTTLFTFGWNRQTWKLWGMVNSYFINFSKLLWKSFARPNTKIDQKFSISLIWLSQLPSCPSQMCSTWQHLLHFVHFMCLTLSARCIPKESFLLSSAFFNFYTCALSVLAT